ncbi:MAG: DHH family phosphoesterase [Candidatus Helarchaeota archaeon]
MEEYPDFFALIARAASRLREWIEKGVLIRVTSHIDADGISAGGIIAAALYHEGARFHARIIRQLEEPSIRELAAEKHEYHVFSDLGSGHLALIKKYMPDENIIILDHHPPREEVPSNCLQVNPHVFGIKGATQISASGICYFVAKALNEKNVDLAPVALAGAIGDRQNKGKKGALIALNQIIVKDGVSKGIIQEKRDLKLPGRQYLPLHLSLKECVEPYLPGLTGNEENCLRFLISETRLKLKDGERYRTISELSKDEKRTFTTKLIEYGLEKGLDSTTMQALVGYVYDYPQENARYLTNADDFSSLLNSCGRQGRAGAGLAICIGDREQNYQEAVKEYDAYKRALQEAMHWIEMTNAIVQKNHIQYFLGENQIPENLIGEITSLLVSSSLILPEKPIFGFTNSDDGFFKTSARARNKLVDEGLNLGKAIKTALTRLKLNTGGGGHNIAAGGRIPASYFNDFINQLDEIIKIQLS